jgi:ribonuclease T1
MTATTRRTALGLVVVVVLAALTWYLQGGGTPDSQDSPGRSGGGDLGTIAVADLPAEAQDTLALIDDGGPFPYPRNDGIVFGNREGLLPDQPSGYYHEYTVPTPGSDDRGARRIVTGGPADDPTDYYWTDDHYRSFEEIRR